MPEKEKLMAPWIRSAVVGAAITGVAVIFASSLVTIGTQKIGTQKAGPQEILEAVRLTVRTLHWAPDAERGFEVRVRGLLGETYAFAALPAASPRSGSDLLVTLALDEPISMEACRDLSLEVAALSHSASWAARFQADGITSEKRSIRLVRDKGLIEFHGQGRNIVRVPFECTLEASR